MNLAQLEEVIELSCSTVNSERKLQATQLISQLHLAPDRWSIGLKLFFESTSDMARMCGLSLVRDYMSSKHYNADDGCGAGPPPETRHSIRQSIMQWVTQSLSQAPLPVYVLNQIVTIIALAIKHDYPELWPTAFDEILPLASTGLCGLDLVVRVIAELELEVVSQNDQRSLAEKSHNSVVKDSMRNGSANRDIVVLLCSSCMSARGAADGGALSARCLRCLSELIKWIDLSLVITEALPTIYHSLRDARLCAAACTCVYELVHKGMDTRAKINLINSIGLVPVLLQVPIVQQDDASSDEEDHVVALGGVVDVLFQELLSCWKEYEDFLMEPGINLLAGGEDLNAFAPTVASMLHALMPFLLQIFSHEDIDISGKVLPALNDKLVKLLKRQHERGAKVAASAAAFASNGGGRYFVASEYLGTLLPATFAQMQFPADFAFDANDDDDADVIEAKKEVRKLFVNISRLHPEPSLEFIAHTFSTLTQPMSSVPFAPLEAALRLAYHFSEGLYDSTNNVLVTQGNFPALLNILHNTDVASHAHSQVLLVYMDLSVRYIKLAKPEVALALAVLFSGERGISHGDPQVRARAAYNLLKMTEAMEQRASSLLPLVPRFAELVLNSGNTEQQQIPEGSELHLLEAASIITSKASPSEQAAAHQVLQEIVMALVGQLQNILSHPQLARYGEQLSCQVAHKVSCLASVAKMHTAKTHPESSPLFEPAAGAVIAACHSLGQYSSVRAKVAVFLHRMILVLGSRCTDLMPHCFPQLLACADTTDADIMVQVLNQLMKEHQAEALPFVDAMLASVLSKFVSLTPTPEAPLAAALDQDAQSAPSPEGAQGGIPYAEQERVALQLQYLVFVNHVSKQCPDALCSAANSPLLESIFARLLLGLQGGVGEGHGHISASAGIPLRKSALDTFIELMRAWSRPTTPPALVTALRNFVLEQALPSIVRDVADSSTISIKDPKNMQLLEQAGVLVWTIGSCYGNDNTAGYLQNLLPALGWNHDATAAVTQNVASGGTQNAFKDEFKRIVRAVRQSR